MEKQMKTQTSGIRSSFARLFVAAALTASSFSLVQAQDSPKKTVDADIKYAGIVGDRILFQVTYNNQSGEPFTVEIKDGQGYQFYAAHFKDKSFKKYFAIDKSEIDKASITFVLSAKTGEQKEVFDVNTTAKVQEEVSVVKL
ncbi:hypothetical protein [Flavisolibacter ginsenosidimutans]|uniref:Uncharacterized protein n=1 Tax=Flavisolibacter ginsenosidimutans TaxID=661481 RepID=A0A5B8UMX2_9BACT|nr:hypothetical protein [Flavisolibacter ginsenosidimutans]QEC58027.1 hypothetical protein FSB75_19660 [Flavisolibacter ginsenosidimutans]